MLEFSTWIQWIGWSVCCDASLLVNFSLNSHPSGAEVQILERGFYLQGSRVVGEISVWSADQLFTQLCNIKEIRAVKIEKIVIIRH